MPGPPRNVDDYLKGVSPVQRAALQKLRKQILALVPGAEECISYSMPAFRARGHVVAGFLATKKGCSFFPFSGTTLDAMASLLTGYSRTKSGLHFDPKRGLPVALLRQLLRARQAEIAAYPLEKKKAALKSTAKKKAIVKKPSTKRRLPPSQDRPATRAR
jgi:uncharacterized protein YdhG (YjbR/CyaY superfamily)